MLKFDVKIDTSAINTKLSRVQQALAQLPDDTLAEFKKNTPIRSGNARRRTQLRQNTIEADYAYAKRLDEGWSRQAPRGMVEPTLKWLRNRIRQIIRMK